VRGHTPELGTPPSSSEDAEDAGGPPLQDAEGHPEQDTEANEALESTDGV